MKTRERVRPYKDMTPEELRLWRAQRPGDYAWKFNQRKLGWSQARAAEWYGVSERQWVRYEAGDSEIPLSLVKRMIANETTFEDTNPQPSPSLISLLLTYTLSPTPVSPVL